jgi:hypothetical protein
VIGLELISERDNARTNLSSQWMHAVQAIINGCNFQLCADVTGNVCSRSVDLREFSATSIPCQNYALFLSIIPKATESEKVYQLTFDDLHAAVSLLCKVRPCSKSDCECCLAIRDSLAEQNVVEYIDSNKIKAQKLQVQNVMCDNFQGIRNFCRAESGMNPILCVQHATSKTLACLCVPAEFLIPWPAGIAASRYSHVKYFANQDAYNEYYYYVVDLCEIGVESFATRAQNMLVGHLLEHFRDGDEIANWCRTF